MWKLNKWKLRRIGRGKEDVEDGKKEIAAFGQTEWG
jgi:hypothetical protein